LAVAALACIGVCVAYLLKLQMRRRALRVAWISAVIVFVLAAASVAVTPGWASAWRYDGRLPAATGCNDEQDTSTVNQWDVLHDDTGDVIAQAQLRRSNTCQTVWVRVRTLVQDASTVKSVSRPFSGWILGFDAPQESDPPTQDWSWSRQVFAPDCVVVDVTVTLMDGTSGTLHQGC